MTTPALAVMPIAASEVAVAERISHPQAMSNNGTITTPPPTPKSALKKPADETNQDQTHLPMLRGWLPRPRWSTSC